MKTALLLAIVAAMVAVACAAPAENFPLQTDWLTAEAAVRQLRQHIKLASYTIKTVAIKDDPIFGRKISKEIKITTKKVNPLLRKITNGVASLKLTIDDAKRLFKKLQNRYNELLENIGNLIDQLSPEAQNTIKEIYQSAVVNANDAINKLTLALQGRPTGGQPIDWVRAEQLVEDRKEIFITAVATIVSTGYEADPTIGHEMSAILNTIIEKNADIYGRMQSDIKEELLDFDNLVDYLWDLDDNRMNGEEKIAPVLNSVPENLAENIRSTYDRVEISCLKVDWQLFSIIFGVRDKVSV